MTTEFVSRPRILGLIEAAASRRVTVMCAPRGYGKTAALREYAGRVPSAYVALPARTSLARFAGDLARAAAPHAPGISLSFAGAYERASQLSDPGATLARWFVSHVGDAPCTIALDDLHHAGSAQIAHFIVSAVERSPNALRWILATETIDEFIPMSSWLAHGLASLPIGAGELKLDASGAKMLAERASSVRSPQEVERLHAETDGRLGDFAFLIRLPPDEDETNFARAAARTFEKFDAQERAFVFRTAPLPALGPVVGYLGTHDSPIIFAQLRRSAPQIFEDDGARYHAGFLDFVRSKLDALDFSQSAQYFSGAARRLESAGDVAGAVQILAQRGDKADIGRLIERHGFAWLEGEHSHILHDALAALDSETWKDRPSIMALRAMIASLGGRFDVAESLFARALADESTAPAQRLRIAYHYASDLMRRGRSDAIELLKPDAAFFDAPLDLRIAIMSALGAAYALAGEIDPARKWVERALTAVKGSRDRLLTARVFHQSAFVAMFAGEHDAAKKFAADATSLAESESAYEVAGGAYSVRYQLALDFDDDVRSAAAYLGQVAAYGAKCGSVEKQLYAVAAAFDIAVERGDDQLVAALECELAEFDVQYSARTAMEALLPAKALQLAGRGDFSRAYAILNASAEQQPTNDRRALRLAEIAVYAAGAGEYTGAAASVAAARKLNKNVPRQSIRSLRTRLFSALALIVLGRLNVARTIVDEVRRDLPAGFPRLVALAGVLEALLARRAGERNHRSLAAALQTLHSLDFGGVARVVESLPSSAARPIVQRAEAVAIA